MAGSNATKSVFGELAKRVPKNQKKQFRQFLELNTDYKKRLNKYPVKLPRIDWDYYRANVRTEAIKMVDEFEKKYEELNKVFDDREKLDTKKYYEELEKQRAVVQAQVKQYIVESNERVKAYEAEIRRLCEMKPYSSMTMEEFINLRPECSTYIPHQGNPLFWPHDPDEQIPGPVGLPKPDTEGGGGDAGGKGGKHPIKPSGVKGSTEGQPATIAAPKSLAQTEAAPEKMPQVKPKEEISSKSVEEPKPHIDKPMSDEERKKLDPCGLIENQGKKMKTEAATLPSEKQPRKVEMETEPRKKSHPCDLVKRKPEPTSKGDDTCKTASKGPYKDEAKRTCVFVDPCNVGLSGGVKTAVEPAVEKAAPKTKPKPQLTEPKKAQPCEIVKKKTEAEKSPSKTAPKKEQSQQMESKKTQPCEVVKKKTEAEKSPSKTAPKKEQSQQMESKKTQPCEVVKKKTEAEKGPYKSTAKPQSKDEKDNVCVFVDPCRIRSGSKEANSKVEKAAIDNEPCTLQPVRPKEVKNAQLSDVGKKPKTETDMTKDKNNFTVVFADAKRAKSSEDRSKTDKKTDNKPCGALPYYNPFRSEEENRRNEEKMCEESENDDPCANDNIEEDYYDPCKDDKYNKDE